MSGPWDHLEDAAPGQVALERGLLAAVMASSSDAIIIKTLDGTVTSWNRGATRILGFEASEMIGNSINVVFPAESADDEKEIMRRVRRGQRTQHHARGQCKDGTEVHLSITVSPLRDMEGHIIGASNIARDITERKHSAEVHKRLSHELDHRVKNTLSIMQSIATQSQRWSPSPHDFVTSFNGRLLSLAKSHEVLVKSAMKEARVEDLVRSQVLMGRNDLRFHCAGPDIHLNSDHTVAVGLLLHELSTNSRRYGALSTPKGELSVEWRVEGITVSQIVLIWRESGMDNLIQPQKSGFGTTLIANALSGTGGSTRCDYKPTGLVCLIRLPLTEEGK